jgi:hypothetical protein
MAPAAAWAYGPINSEFVTKFAYEEYKTPTVLGHSIIVGPLFDKMQRR